MKQEGLYFVVKVPPGPSSQFVDVEDHEGRSLCVAGMEWKQRADGLWEFGPFVGPLSEQAAQLKREA